MRDRRMALSGVIPPLCLPLDGRQRVDRERLGEQARRLAAAGSAGLWVNGTTGEFFAVDEAERAAVVRAVVNSGIDIPVVAQIGATSTRLAIRNAELAADAGAAALASLVPFYLRYERSEILDHFRAIAQAVALPLYVYHLPQMTGVTLEPSVIAELAGDGVIVGVKDSSGDIGYFKALTVLPDLETYIGTGALADVSLAVGGTGLMCAIANVVPALVVSIYQAAQGGDWSRAIREQRILDQVIAALRLPGRREWGATLPVYKFVLRELGIFSTAEVFAPIAPLSDDEETLLRERALPLVYEHSGMAART